MRRATTVAWLAAWALAGPAAAAPLTLEEALASVTQAHPERRIAESELALARADRAQAGSRQDFYFFLDGGLRTGRRPDGDWKPDNVVRLVARKPLLDFGRTRHALVAADAEVSGREALLVDADAARRVEVMARYFDVLLADMQYAADNEFFAVAYVSWDNARDRFEVGQISQPELLRQEASYQDIRERRNASLQRVRSARERLANAMNRPGVLPTELAEPALAENTRAVPEYGTVLTWVLARNPQIRALQAQIDVADARVLAIRAERRPLVDAEVLGGAYSREATTRDELSAGLVFSVPLYQGGRVDARMARELALKERAAAELEKLKLDLADAVLATVHEIEWLRESARPAAETQIAYRDWALERARGEYELELKTNLGTSMAETQLAQLRRKQVDYRLALALARLEAFSGGRLPPAEGASE